MTQRSTVLRDSAESVDKPPVWIQERQPWVIDTEKRIAELQRILDEKLYSPEEQKINIEMAVQLYQKGVLPWPIGEFVFIQDGQLCSKPSRLPGASCYWGEGVMLLGYGNYSIACNEPGKQMWPPFDVSSLPEPSNDEQRSRISFFLQELDRKPVDQRILQKLDR